ncbi:hypothetical protein [Sandaracinus amylolyticus]|uniref:hypothetical protein n=1 Tax=Sandaracinus amylolyticus TaxID=927083 RepID=UPI001F29F992|nr:hypothetical protein [Sandaracinus amylolyticus]UJR84913.1 Hypothetical protein I5071_69920 [Sandaracinus amylolyticus]
MTMRARTAVVLATWLVVAVAAAQSRDHAGQVELTFTIHDRGVAQVAVLRYELDAVLSLARDGRARLRVRGTLDRTHTTMIPPGGPSDETSRHLAVDRVHEGRVRARDADGITIAFDDGLDWRCDRTTERIAERSRAVLRCAVATPHAGLPWRDPAPAYLRAPMVLAPDGDVRAVVDASAERSPYVRLAPRR